jgi:hypothetical protein
MKTLNSPGLTPCTFLVLALATDPIISRVTIAALLAPVIFIPLSLLGLEPISPEYTGMIVSKLVDVWPTLQTQYAHVYDKGPQLNAANYVLFAGYLTALTAIASLATIVFYLRTLAQPKAISKADIFLFLIFGTLAYFVLYKDMPPSSAASLLDFRTDAVSLFLRQWFLMLNVTVSSIIAVATVMTVVSFVAFAMLRGRGDENARL